MPNVYDVDHLRRKLAVIETYQYIEGAKTYKVLDLEDSMSFYDPFFNIQPRHAMVDGHYYGSEHVK